MRSLIVNADDFGQSPGVNRGIMQAREKGIVTSTSLMVRWPAAREAAAYARRNPDFSVGLHLDFCEWTYREGDWKPLYEVVSLSDGPAAEAEVWRQLGAFEVLVGKPPTHLDSHQHMHLRPSVLPRVEKIAATLGVPLRRRSSQVRYCGDFYGQLEHGEPFPEGVSVERLLGILQALPEGYTELGCHPGFAADLETMYGRERETELATLCDPAIRAAIQTSGINLCSFAGLRG